MSVLRNLLVVVFVSLAGITLAQGTQLSFGPLAQDTDAPIEIEADELAISQADNSATFTGNVVIKQGEMSLAAPLVTVVYNPETSDIDLLVATGGVTLVSGNEAAEAETAEYSVITGVIIMRGDVLLAQGLSSLAAEEMTVNLSDGSALLSGRVRTILRPQGSN
ncbi:MAG: LptA/OstA family protein [Paracoccaceae bacterium]|nr:LptA/OstA family protein [Paracoccaceae bacterium]MDG1736333.1 LptA/OstA family protein [Paracoccaceae bacterium]MDG2257870.1 LptA/OstA family protein [Paracoccaceae bacterium]